MTLTHARGTLTVPYLYVLDLPPDVGVAPTVITATASHLEIVTSTLTVTNSGAGDLAFDLAGAGAATSGLASLPQPEGLDLKTVVIDSEGDAGGGPPVVDIIRVDGVADGRSLTLRVVFSADTVTSSISGFILLDTDQDPRTGDSPALHGGSAAQDIGADYILDLTKLASTSLIDLFQAEGNLTSTLVGSYVGRSIEIVVPLSGLGGDDGSVDLTLALGNGAATTDLAPNKGHGTIGKVPWLCFSPSSGTVPSGGSVDVTVSINCDRRLGPAEHYSEIVIDTNDPITRALTVPVTVRVLEPDIGVSPNAFVLVLEPGQTSTDTLTVSNFGTGTLRFTAAVRQPDVSGGPDGFGYVWSDGDDPAGPAFSWIEIAGSGTQIGGGDDESYAIPIGFGFRFYGTTHTIAYVGTNGLMGFASTSVSSPFNTPLPLAPAPNNIIAAFWADLEVQSAGRLVYELLGQAPARRLVVQWDGVQEFGDVGASHTFEIVLEEATGAIVVQYLSMNGDLDSATVGIESAGGEDGLTTAYNEGYVRNGLAVRYSRGSVFVSIVPASATIASGGSIGVGVTFDAAGLDRGPHSADVVIESNDPDEPQVVVPVTLAVPLPSIGEWGLLALVVLFAGLLALRTRRSRSPSTRLGGLSAGGPMQCREGR
ncbi:MAG: hypothetical protein IH848_03330 [Acidobacteria bacterium]|nr:hypothetical protein [Acidobacteriota bacterium]